MEEQGDIRHEHNTWQEDELTTAHDNTDSHRRIPAEQRVGT